MNITNFAHNGVDHGVTTQSHAETGAGQGTLFWAGLVSLAAIVLAYMVIRQLSRARQKPVPQEQEEE